MNAGRRQAVHALATLVEGARRLGAAFQEVNFLRDPRARLRNARTRLPRPGVGQGPRRPARPHRRRPGDGAGQHRRTSSADCRPAVCAAHDLFAALAARPRSAPADGERVRVPDLVKARHRRSRPSRLPVRRQRIAAAVAGIEPRDRHRGGDLPASPPPRSWPARAMMCRCSRRGMSSADGRGAGSGRLPVDTGPSWYLMPRCSTTSSGCSARAPPEQARSGAPAARVPGLHRGRRRPHRRRLGTGCRGGPVRGHRARCGGRSSPATSTVRGEASRPRSVPVPLRPLRTVRGGTRPPRPPPPPCRLTPAAHALPGLLRRAPVLRFAPPADPGVPRRLPRRLALRGAGALPPL